MCGTCGCSEPARLDSHQCLPNQNERLIEVEHNLLDKNNQLAAKNRTRLAEQALCALNVMSSPGSGKTTLLVETITRLKNELPVAVIEGDQQTEQDAERIRASGAPAVQINTGKGCHLDAHAISHALDKLSLTENGLIFIENVGNLVCPAAFDLGERVRILVLSVTEGEDKPLKYPDMFKACDLLIINKIDLLPHLDFDVEQCLDYARRINPNQEVIQLSARTGEGFDEWLNWLKQTCLASRPLATA